MRRPRRLWTLLALLGILPFPALGAAAPFDLATTCTWVGDEEALPTPTLRELLAGPDEAIPEGCRPALECLAEARGEGSSAAAAVSDLAATLGLFCWPPDGLMHQPRADIDTLRQELSAAPGGGSEHAGCDKLLDCLLERMTTAADDAGDWRAEFDRICTRTEDAATLPREEVEELLAASDALLAQLEAMKIPEAKVFIYRLDLCRSFFEYALEYQDRESEEGG